MEATNLVNGQPYRHERHVAEKGIRAVQHPEFHWVNTLLGNLKTALSGTYHAFNHAKYAHIVILQSFLIASIATLIWLLWHRVCCAPLLLQILFHSISLGLFLRQVTNQEK